MSVCFLCGVRGWYVSEDLGLAGHGVRGWGVGVGGVA